MHFGIYTCCGLFAPQLNCSNSICSKQKFNLDLAKFGVTANKKTKDNLHVYVYTMKWTDLEQSNHGAKWP